MFTGEFIRLPEMKTPEFLKLLKEKMAFVQMKPEFAKREVNVGFSGGEKKRNEIFQMALLDPTLSILDETDSGLDVDALKIVADGVNALRSPEKSAIIITHYQKLLEYVRPDVVHVLKDGRIVRTGGPELIEAIEKGGFDQLVFRVAFKPTSSIAKAQETYDFAKGEMTSLQVPGRHDTCFALRTPVIVEAMAAIVLADLVGMA